MVNEMVKTSFEAEKTGKMNLTMKELLVLILVNRDWNGNTWQTDSDGQLSASFYHDDVDMKKMRGVLSSLVKKGIIGASEDYVNRHKYTLVSVNNKYTTGVDDDGIGNINWNMFDCKDEIVANMGYENFIEWASTLPESIVRGMAESKMAETFDVEFNEWADQEMMTHGKDISFKDWAEDEGMKHGNTEITEWAQHEDESHDARYGAEEVGCPKCGDEEDYFLNECCDTPNCINCGNECYVRVNNVGRPINEDHVVNCTEHQCCTEFMGGSRLYGAEEIPEYERYKGNDLIIEPQTGNFARGKWFLYSWGQGSLLSNPNHSYYAFKEAYDTKEEAIKANPTAKVLGAEEGEDCPSCANACKHDDTERIKVESIYDYEVQSPSNMVIQVTCLDCGESGTFYADDVDWHGEEAKLRYSPQIAVNMMNPTYGDLRCSRCHERFQMAAENWGGDPKGKLAIALQKARDKAKEPKKPLKIEKLGAETSGLEKRKIGETVAWNNSIIGMDGKWCDGVYDLYEIGNQIGYVVVHQDIHNSENEWEENSVLLGSKGTDIAEISFAGLNIYTGSDGSFPIVGIYERIEDYYSRTQNKPHPTKHMTMDEKFSHDDYEKMQYLEDKWEKGFIEWAQTVYDFKDGYDLHFYTAKDLLQEEHKLLVGARISISNPSKPHLEQRDSKSSVWVMEYPNLTNLTKGQYRSFTVGTNDIFINTENTVDTFFANLQKQYPDGKIEEYDRGWNRSKKFSIKIPTFGTYTWRATEQKLAYESLTDEELKRKRELESQKRQKEYAQQRKEKQDALRAKYDAETFNADEAPYFWIACGRCGWDFTNEYIENNTDGNIRPMYGDHCSCGGIVKRYDFEPEPKPKPKGFFAKLFGKNAETSGQWEIGEQLEEAQMNAEFLYYYVLNEKGEQPADFDTLEEAQAYVANSSEPLEIYERRSRNDESHKMDKKMNAEDYSEDWFDPYEHGESSCEPCWSGGGYDEGMAPAADYTCVECEVGLCEGCYDPKSEMCWECVNEKATVKEAKGKRSGLLSDPFDEASLDSGGIKKWLAVGIIGGLAYLGYNKWK